MPLCFRYSFVTVFRAVASELERKATSTATVLGYFTPEAPEVNMEWQ